MNRIERKKQQPGEIEYACENCKWSVFMGPFFQWLWNLCARCKRTTRFFPIAAFPSK